MKDISSFVCYMNSISIPKLELVPLSFRILYQIVKAMSDIGASAASEAGCSGAVRLPDGSYVLPTAEESVNSREVPDRSVRQVYLLTYSQADMDIFPTRKSFARAVVDSFTRSHIEVLHWICCREKHANGGVHYHMAIKLKRCHRWLSSKNYLSEEYGISVHYSNAHFNYYSAWQYVSKDDEDVVFSAGHPDLWNKNPPKTAKASKRLRKSTKCKESDLDDTDEGHDPDDDNGTSQGKSKATKKKRLSAFDLSEIIVEKNIKTRTELLALANQQKNEGKSDIAQFIVNRGPKVVAEVLNTAWEMNTAEERLSRTQKTRMEILAEARNSQCTRGCEGMWIQCATEVLQNNGVSVQGFSDAVKLVLEKGRGKYRNVMIVGPANCGKTFILSPLTSIYNTFRNPACTSFAWVGAEQAECIFLNDFRWSPQVISWNDMLLLLEGQLVHLPAPKTHFAKDIAFEKDTPIFCTGKYPIVFIKNGVIDERETEMMTVRWRVFNFNYQIPAERQRDIPACPKCFASLILG